MRSWMSASGPTASVVTTVVEISGSAPFSGRHVSHSPASASDAPEGSVMKNGVLRACLPVPSRRHSNHPSAGSRHRRDAAARRFLSAGPDGLQADEAERVMVQLRTVLAHPALAPLFEPDALVEQPISGVVDGIVVTGQLDRMRVLPDQVLFCDFKTNRRTPATPEQVPVPYLRQMAAYRALLVALYPDRPVRCTLVWTQEASVMPLAASLLQAHAPGTYRAGSADPAAA